MALAVKICGVRDAEAARACVAAGVDFAGLNFVPSSRRRVTVGDAAALLPLLGPVTAVGVFQDAPADEVRRIARRVGLGWVQLHGDEPVEACVALRAAGLRVIKALALRDARDVRALADYAPVVDLLLLDGPRPGGGERFEYALLRGSRLDRPFLLAGGLSPENVAFAVRAVRPYGVDAASGVEREGRPDADRIEAFCRAARSEER